MRSIQDIARELVKRVKAMEPRLSPPTPLPPPSGPGGYWREAGRKRERMERYLDSLKARTRAMTPEQRDAVVARLKARRADKDA